MGTNKISIGTRTQVSALGTDLRSIVRLNLFHNDAFHVGFVLDKALQLKEAPVTNPIIHSLSSVLFPDSFEVFHNNLVSLEVGNNVFAYVVINPSHITSFSSRDFFKQSLAGTSAFSLELSPEIFESSFGLLHNTTIKEPCVACDCEVVYSEVNTQNDTLRATVLLNGINLFRESENEKASAFSINPENALADFPVEIFFVAGRNAELELLTGFEQSQNEDFSFEISTSRKIILDARSLDDGLSLCLLNHSASLTYASNSELSRQSLPEMLVNKGMELNIIPNLPAPSIIDAELQSLSISFDGSDYFISGVNLDFSTDGCSHNTCKEQQIFKTIGNEETGFLPYLKIGVSALTTL
jgi:hypothetical protein